MYFWDRVVFAIAPTYEFWYYEISVDIILLGKSSDSREIAEDVAKA